MTAETIRLIHRTLQKYDARRLGEGDAMAGANLLAAMACAIASIHKPESYVEDPDTGQRLLAGADLLVSGTLTTGLVGEYILSELAINQGNVLSHIKAMSVRYEHYKRKANGNFNRPLEASLVDLSSEPMYGIESKEFMGGMMSSATSANPKYVQLSRKPEWRDLFSLVRRPVVYMTGATREEIHRLLDQGHLGQPLIQVPLTSPAQCAALDSCCLELLHGTAARQTPGLTVRGRLLAMDVGGVLPECSDTRWLRRLVRLVDDAPFELPDAPDDMPADMVVFNGIHKRFRKALEHAWGMRLSLETPGVRVTATLAPMQEAWIEFLREMESQCPGVTGAARALPVTILFGLCQMHVADRATAGFNLTVDDSYALARLLVVRMCNHHAALTYSAADTRRLRQLDRIANILSCERPLMVRDISRKFHNMAAENCRSLLQELQACGRVIALDNGKWTLAGGPVAALCKQPQPLLLEA